MYHNFSCSTVRGYIKMPAWNLGHYWEDYHTHHCPHCYLSMPEYPQCVCLSTQYDLCQNWGHSDQFCPGRCCDGCNTFEHVLDDCSLKTLLQNRQQLSLQEDRYNQGIITLLWQGSVHIEPGSQLYEGGNVIILFLSICSSVSYFFFFHFVLLLPSQDSFSTIIITIFSFWDCLPSPICTL